MFMPMLDTNLSAAASVTITTNETSQFTASNRSVYTVIANAGAGGFVVMSFSSRELNASDAISVTSITIDGVTATVVEEGGTGAGAIISTVAYADGVSSGTVTVVVTYTDTASELVWATYTITGHTSTTPHDTKTATGNGVTASVSLNIPAGGCAVCLAGFLDGGTSGDNLTYVGVVENNSVGGFGQQFGWGSDSVMGVETGRTVSVSFDPGTAEDYNIISISWG